MTLLAPLFQRLGIEPRDVAGASLAGEIPISESVVNRLLAKRLAGHIYIASITIAAQDNDVILARIEPRARLIPPLNVNARIERQPELPDDAVLRLRWSLPTVGPLAMAAGPFLSYFKATPPGVRIERDIISVDLRELLRARGLEEVLQLIRRVTLHTRSGAFVVQIDARL